MEIQMRTVTYARVSTQKQADCGYSLGEQESLLREHCLKNELLLVEHVADEGISGIVEDRPGIRRIRHLADAKQIDAVLTMSVDRLSRDHGLTLQIVDWLQARAVK